MDYYSTSYADGTRLDELITLSTNAGIPFAGAFEMGVSIANQAAPAPSVTLAYLKYLQGVAAANPGGYYMWYQQQDRNLHNVIPEICLPGQDGGPDTAIPDLQKLSDIVTNFGP